MQIVYNLEVTVIKTIMLLLLQEQLIVILSLKSNPNQFSNHSIVGTAVQ